jgi:hypothetical protein
MTTSWSPTFTNCVISVTITSSTAFTAIGALMFRLCLIEREVHFATAPGINAEKDFYNVVRKSYPTAIAGSSVTAMGTPLSGIWTQGQTQTFTVSCDIPNYIHDLSQMAFVGFVQDDGDRKVYQASRTSQPTIPNDIKAVAIKMPNSCNGVFTPSFIVQNLGNLAITALTVAPYKDGVAQPILTFTNNITALSTATLIFPAYTALDGSHTYSATITGVSGGDLNPVNNSTVILFGVNSSTTSGIAEGFNSFPPPSWYVLNYDQSPATWGASTVGGYSASVGSVKYDFYNNFVPGDADDLYMPALNLSGIANVVLSFDVAYAQISNENDKLEVLASTNCGISWSSVYSKQGAVLATAPPFPGGPFSPAANQWRTETVNLASLANQPSVLMKFVAHTDYGNNLYLDNVNIGQATSIGKNGANIASCSVFPNPVSGSVSLSISVPENETVGITVVNSVGQMMYSSKNNNLHAGVNNIELNTEAWSPGIYFISVSTANGAVNTRLSVIR